MVKLKCNDLFQLNIYLGYNDYYWHLQLPFQQINDNTYFPLNQFKISASSSFDT